MSLSGKIGNLSEGRKKELLSLTALLSLNIDDLVLLNSALTHASFVKEKVKNKHLNNERLEFFGDAVLKLFISEYLMSKYKNYSEGQLSKLRAHVVSEKVLVNVANKINLKKYILVGKNEKRTLPVSILADSMEALLAVIYYQCGTKLIRDFILKYWKEYIEEADKDVEQGNYKAILQEYLQGNKLGLPIYKTMSESGPDHDKRFEVAVYLNHHELSRGTGKTKKEASQFAAKNALIILQKKN